MAVAIFMTGGVIDYMSLINQKQQLQGVADRAAIAAAQELIVFKGTDGRVNAVAETFVDSSYTTSAPDNRRRASSTTARPSKSRSRPTADLSSRARSRRATQTVTVKATAEISGGGYVCMIGLSPTEALDAGDARQGARDGRELRDLLEFPLHLVAAPAQFSPRESRSRLRRRRRRRRAFRRHAEQARRGLSAAGRPAARPARAECRPARVQQHPRRRQPAGQRPSRQGRQAAQREGPAGQERPRRRLAERRPPQEEERC